MRVASSLRGRRTALDAALALVLLALPWLLYGSALDLWWTEDDFLQLRYTLEHAPAEYTFDPEVWQRLPNRVLSPLLFASYDLDLAVAGLEPRAFYAHQLLSLGLAAIALFVLLRLWLSPPLSVLGGVTFLLGPPTASLASHLMVRHYPEAILLGLVAATSFVVAVRRSGTERWILSVASAVLYLMASMAKEVAVPLPAALALLPVGTMGRRLGVLLPHGAVLVLYALYRTWMLGSFWGGYGFALGPEAWPTAALALPRKLARELAGPSAWGAAALVAIAVPILLHAFRSRRVAGRLATGCALAALPVLPVSVAFVPRYAAVAWLVLAAALPPAVRALAEGGAVDRRRHGAPRAQKAPEGSIRFGRPGAWTVAVAILAVTLAGNRASWSGHYARAERMSAENRGFLALEPGGFLRHPAGPPAAMGELRVFARDVLGDPARGGWFYDDLFLCLDRPGPRIRTLWSFAADPARLVETTSELETIRERSCARIRWNAPLTASFRRESSGVLAWTLGPYSEGRYAFVLEDGRIRHDVPGEGGFHVPERWHARLRVRYESPSGWVTYSPPLDLDLAAGGEQRWRRPRR